MNGSRSSTSRPGGTSSLDALSRTIEGLEARIEGLMGGSARDGRAVAEEPRRAASRERYDELAARSERTTSTSLSNDPLAEIRQRQRALDTARQQVEPRPPAARQAPVRYEERPRPNPEERRLISREPLQTRATAPLSSPSPRQPPPPAPRAPIGPSSGEIATKEITQALINLRQDLKKDISEGFTREIATLRTEMRAIKTIAEKRHGVDDFREDLARLADSIKQLGDRPQQGTEGLRAEFEDLRSLMDGLAREESVRTIGSHWDTLGNTLDTRFQAMEPIDVRDDIAGLADRLEAIKHQIGAISDSRSVRVLEEKLIAVANALEQIGSQFDPQERALTNQFQGIDNRLDEISRAIAAGVRSTPNPIDSQVIARLEDRLSSIGHQIDTLADHALTRDDSWSEPMNDLGLRIEALTARIEDLSHDHSASRLEERIDQLSLLVEETQRPVEQPELTGYLADISRRIEALDHGAVNERLAERLDYLAQRIDELEIPVPAPTPVIASVDDRLLRGLEQRIDQIAERLDDARHAPAEDKSALRGLEQRLDQIAEQLNDVRRAPAEDKSALRGLEQRLDQIAEQLDDVRHAPAEDKSALRGLEQRLDQIADRLDDARRAPVDDKAALRGLEEQIAQLSMQLNSTPSSSHAASLPMDDGVTGRIAALEDYMATSDEYIVEAARQAAEAVMETYSQQQSQPHQTVKSSGDMETLAALASNLKHLEDISRGTEERTSRTFEALQETLLQIADRLDHIDRPAPVSAPKVEPTPLFQTASRPASRESLAEMAEAKLAEQSTVAASVQWEPERIEEIEPEITNAVSAMIDEVADERKPAKPSLLAGLGRRLIPGQKKSEDDQDGRLHIDPSPSIDPGDMLPDEEANELLEPGSGAPDVRKILERVRATQSDQRGRGDAPVVADTDRTDYIAAARRAAQAAAEEMERTPRGAAHGAVEIEAGNAKSGSLISRYRRPIMMAIGAILLAAMAMPLVNTLTRGDSAPQMAIESSDPSANSPLPAPVAEQQTQPATNDTAMELPAEPATPMIAGTDGATEPDGTSLPEEPSLAESETLQAPPMAEMSPEAPAAPETAATTSAPASSEIVVPEEIKPASLSIAAKDGDPLALFEIAARYTEGRGVTSDLSAAAKWYQLSADRGFAPALYRLANLYEKGSGVERNLDTARHYYEMAAAKGNASAMHNLAVLHASGASGSQDYTEAAKWFERAADLGVTDSQFNLAILYARGNGVPQDLEASYKWFAIAAKDGDKDAAQKRDEVANSMRPEQLEKARATVDSWKALPLDVDANAVNPPDEWVGTGVKTASVDMKKAILNIQAILNRNGYDTGVPDGVMGKKTVAAIKSFQTSVGQEPTGQVTDELVKALLARNK